MKRDTRQAILCTAKALFNERGYDAVSTGDISNALGISKGNLTYHFKRKEDVMEAIVEEMHSHYVKPSAPTSLAALQALFIRVQKVTEENAFYFWHYTQLAQMSPRIQAIQSEVVTDRISLFTSAFQTLQSDAILRAEEHPGHYAQLIQAILLICTYWVPHSKLIRANGTEMNMLDCLWGVISPMLTDQGIDAYNKIQPCD